MGLKSFLQEQGFIAKDDTATEGYEVKSSATPPPIPMAPVVFPSQSTGSNDNSSQPAFVQELPNTGNSIDPAFIKFYEDELVKANLPGPDYFEFRQQMNTMNQKLAHKGVAPDVILQTVLTSFEAQDIPATKLVDAAKHYKTALSDKKDNFLKGAAGEKENQLQKRSTALQTHQSNIDDISRQIGGLQQQIQQLEQNLAKERTQMEVDKTMGKEGIEKIERAEQQIALAYTYMTTAIDKDIALLQS